MVSSTASNARVRPSSARPEMREAHTEGNINVTMSTNLITAVREALTRERDLLLKDVDYARELIEYAMDKPVEDPVSDAPPTAREVKALSSLLKNAVELAGISERVETDRSGVTEAVPVVSSPRPLEKKVTQRRAGSGEMFPWPETGSLSSNQGTIPPVAEPQRDMSDPPVVQNKAQSRPLVPGQVSGGAAPPRRPLGSDRPPLPLSASKHESGQRKSDRGFSTQAAMVRPALPLTSRNHDTDSVKLPVPPLPFSAPIDAGERPTTAGSIAQKLRDVVQSARSGLP